MPKSPQNWPFRIGLYLGSAGTRPCDTSIVSRASILPRDTAM
ncbi:hypothetical protein F383_33715 [Gossypium arboreum]|uniref:Uncharacterized protein n=1 Tax=Gossypium arboreum TaxID=29729 RepID=A0A0B0N1R2_GOSAR|nr:hypothetical protein F383_33715 [Gossypium arboreum]